MNREPFDDTRDEALADALRAAMPEPPTDDVDWSALHARIAMAVQPHFADQDAATNGIPDTRPVPTPSRHAPWRPARPAAQAWWQPLAGWSPRGIPLAAAATVLLLLAAAALGTAASGEPANGDVAISFHTVEEELVNGLAPGTRPLLAGMEAEAMLDAVLFSEGEDW